MVQNHSSLDKKNNTTNSDDKTLEAQLLAALYRQDCPETMDLGEYQLGLLSESQQSRIRAHLNRCSHCQAELTRLTDFLVEEEISQPWILREGFKWFKKKTGQVIIHLQAVLLPPSPQLAPIGIKGYSDAEPGDVLRRIVLEPDETDDLALEATIRRISNEPQFYTLTVRAEIPSCWPELAGTQIQATAGNWQVEGQTDDDGEVTFEKLPASLADSLVIEVSPRRRV